MKKLLFSIFTLSICSFLMAQVDSDQFALDVSKAEAANVESLKAMIWKRHSSATVEGEVKATAIYEISFDENDEIQATQITQESNVKQKPGLRGRAQQSAMDDNTDYVGQALDQAMAYTYMSKGQLLDFFGKAVITEAGDAYQIVGDNILVKGDKLTVVVEKATNLFMSKTFTTTLGEDAMSGDIKYDKFSSGVSHVTGTTITLAAKNAVIDAKNQDYTQRIQ